MVYLLDNMYNVTVIVPTRSECFSGALTTAREIRDPLNTTHTHRTRLDSCAPLTIDAIMKNAKKIKTEKIIKNGELIDIEIMRKKMVVKIVLCDDSTGHNLKLICREKIR